MLLVMEDQWRASAKNVFFLFCIFFCMLRKKFILTDAICMHIAVCLPLYSPVTQRTLPNLITGIYFRTGSNDCLCFQIETDFSTAYGALLDTHKCLTPPVLTHTSVLFIPMGIKPPISTVGWRISRLNQTSLKSRASDLTLRRSICSVGACFLSILYADRYIQSGLLLTVTVMLVSTWAVFQRGIPRDFFMYGGTEIYNL